MQTKIISINKNIGIFLLSLSVCLGGFVPQTWADEETHSPDATLGTSPIPPGGTITVTYDGATGGTFAPPHVGNIFVVEHTTPLTGPFITGFGPPCTAIAVSGGPPGTLWRFSTIGGSAATYTLPALASSITVTFPGDPSPVLASGATLTAAISYAWTPVAPSLEVAHKDTIGDTWGFMTCGREANGIGVPLGSTFSRFESFEVIKPVGGEFLPIDTTALVIAGLQTSGLWMLSALGAVAVAGFGMLYFQIKRKQ